MQTVRGLRSILQDGWNEVKEKYEHLEIVKDKNQDGFGIGIIIK